MTTLVIARTNRSSSPPSSRSWAIDAIIIIYEDHVAVGVACSDASGTYYELSGVNYYYCETTGDGWNIGQIPDDRDSAVLIQVS